MMLPLNQKLCYRVACALLFWIRTAETKPICQRTAPPASAPAEVLSSPMPSDYVKAEELPENFDWRNVNGQFFVSKVETQLAPKATSTCWAYAATGAFSDRYRIATGGFWVANVAAQVLLNYDEKFTGGGVQGGDHYGAAHFFYKYGITDDTCAFSENSAFAWGVDCCGRDAPMDVEHVRKYLCHICNWNGTCGWVPQMTKPVDGWVDGYVLTQDGWAPPTTWVGTYRLYRAEAFGRVQGETAMMIEIYARGPIACSIDSSHDAFDKYRGGIIDVSERSSRTDHAVVIAGFGIDASTKMKIWSGRNSYGTSWGESGGGWFRIRRGRDVLMVESGGCSWAVPHKEDVESLLDAYQPPASSWEPLVQKQEEETSLSMLWGSMTGPRRRRTDLPLKRDLAEIPEDFDWRNVNGKNFATKSTTQHGPQICESCWAHGVMGAFADRIRVATNASIYVIPAVQVLLNFDEKVTGGGCTGGYARKGARFVKKFGTSDDTCVPYKGAAFTWGQECCTLSDKVKMSNMTEEFIHKYLCYACTWTNECDFVPASNYQLYQASAWGYLVGEENMLVEIYTNGPITCMFDSLPDPFDLYNGTGIIDPPPDSGLTDGDHNIILTGFGVEKENPLQLGMEFWSGRNTWGTHWGKDGWFRIRRGINAYLIESIDCIWMIPSQSTVDRLLSGYHPPPSSWPLKNLNRQATKTMNQNRQEI